MSPIHLLSASLIVFSLPATAQTRDSHASPAGSTIIAVPAQASAIHSFSNVRGTDLAPLTAQLYAPCFTIRSYLFTFRDLQSDNPHASGYSTCTPAASSKMKNLVVPARVTPIK